MLSHLDSQKAKVLEDTVATLGAFGQNELAEKLLDVLQGPEGLVPTLPANGFIGSSRYAAGIQAPATGDSSGHHLQIEGFDQDIGPNFFNSPLNLTTGEVDIVESIPPAFRTWYDPRFVSLPTGPRPCDPNLRPTIHNLGFPEYAPFEYGVQKKNEQYNSFWCQSGHTENGNGQVNTQAHPLHSPDPSPFNNRQISGVSLLQYGIPQIENTWGNFEKSARPIPFQEPSMHHQLVPMLPWPTQDPSQAWIVPESPDHSANPLGIETSWAHGADYAPASSLSCGLVPGASPPTDHIDPHERAKRHKRDIKKGSPRPPGLDRVVKRRPFPDSRTKEETNLTRNLKACMRCHLYRIRVGLCAPRLGAQLMSW